MCVAVVVPAGQRLSDEQITAMHQANNDSWGFAFLDKYGPSVTNPPHGYKGYIRSVKNTSNTDAAISAYNSSIKSSPGLLDFPHLAHFRITTAGETNYSNAHPFQIEHGAMVHNGHLPGNISASKFSDTAQFAEATKGVFRPGMSDDIINWIEDCIGYNKLAFLWRDGTTTIVNKDAGAVLPNGVWVSNTHWQRRL